MLKFAIPLLLAALLQLIVSLGILLESRRSRAVAQRFFAGLTATTLLWTLANIVILYADTEGTVANIQYFNWANKAGFALGVASLLLIYTFNLVYPVAKKTHNFSKFIIGFGLSLILLTPFDVISGHFDIEKGMVVYSAGVVMGLIAAFGALV